MTISHTIVSHPSYGGTLTLSFLAHDDDTRERADLAGSSCEHFTGYDLSSDDECLSDVDATDVLAYWVGLVR